MFAVAVLYPQSCMFGDFNEILEMHEKEGGALRWERQIDAFRAALGVCECRDLGYRGNIFTWQRGKSMDTVVRERLDRFVADNNWCNMFPYAEVIHFPICYSDHGAFLLKFGERPEKRQHGRLFWFEALWLSNDDCGRVMADAWKFGENVSVNAKIQQVATSLASWASKTCGPSGTT